MALFLAIIHKRAGIPIPARFLSTLSALSKWIFQTKKKLDLTQFLWKESTCAPEENFK